MQAERVTAIAQTAVTAEKFPAVMGDLSVVASNKTIVDAQTAPAHRFLQATLKVLQPASRLSLTVKTPKCGPLLAVVLAGNPSLIAKCIRPVMKLRLT
jgi:hypothetical protein